MSCSTITLWSYLLHLFLLVLSAWRTSFKEQTRVSRLSAFLNPDSDTLHSYPLPSPGLSSSDRLPFGLEENGGTPFTTKPSGRHHHHHHQHQHHTSYGLSLTLESKEGLSRSPNSSSKSLTSKLGHQGQGGRAVLRRVGGFPRCSRHRCSLEWW